LSEKSDRRKTAAEEAEVEQVLSVVSTEVNALIKSIVADAFSEETGRNKTRAAAATFYKALKDSGMPDEVAEKMTEGYVGVFTGLGEILKDMRIPRM
jgi:hypothetical protein